MNAAMVDLCRERGLEVSNGDALEYVSALADGSIGGVFASQVIEHLQPDYLARLLEIAARKIRRGGLIVLETINPACWLAFFESYLRDLTHVRPIHPETLQHLLRVSGFHDISVLYKSPVGDKLETVPTPIGSATPDMRDLVVTFNDNITKLNARLFSYQDYAAIGRI
jgi:hypothetical protein